MPELSSTKLNYWQYYDTLAKMLSGRSAGVLTQEMNWKDLLALADDHLVTPALAKPWRKLPYVPTDIRDYAEAMLELNRHRNAQHLLEIERVNAILFRQGIKPIWLKGAASLLSGLYADAAERIVGDLDLLVSPKDFPGAHKVLVEAGFEFINPKLRNVIFEKHLPRLRNRKGDMSLELHHAILDVAHVRLLPTDPTIMRARAVSYNGKSYNILSPIDRLVHNIAHLQNMPSGRHDLRQLREFVLLNERPDSFEILTQARQRFSEENFDEIFFNHVASAVVLFHMEYGLEPDKGLEFMRRYKQLQIDGFKDPIPDKLVPRMKHVLRPYLRALLINPRLAVEPLTRSWWTQKAPSLFRRLIGKTS